MSRAGADETELLESGPAGRAAGPGEAADGAEPPETPVTPGTRVSATVLAGLGIGLLGAVAAALAAGRDSQSEPPLARNESVLFRARPRKAPGRYLSTLGLWELHRRRTLFAVTNRRVIVEHGGIRRHSQSIPLSGIADIDVVSGPLEGVVRVAEVGSARPYSAEIGPLPASAARRLAATITRAMASY